MKVAVTAQGPELKSPVDPRFGRAAWFVIVDTDEKTTEAVDNSENVQAARGAGIQAAQSLAQRGIEAVITGNVGPNAFRALSTAGIKVYVGAEGTVEEAVEALKADKLQLAEDATVAGGSGWS